MSECGADAAEDVLVRQQLSGPAGEFGRGVDGHRGEAETARLRFATERPPQQEHQIVQPSGRVGRAEHRDQVLEVGEDRRFPVGTDRQGKWHASGTDVGCEVRHVKTDGEPTDGRPPCGEPKAVGDDRDRTERQSGFRLSSCAQARNEFGGTQQAGVTTGEIDGHQFAPGAGLDDRAPAGDVVESEAERDRDDQDRRLEPHVERHLIDERHRPRVGLRPRTCNGDSHRCAVGGDRIGRDQVAEVGQYFWHLRRVQGDEIVPPRVEHLQRVDEQLGHVERGHAGRWHDAEQRVQVRARGAERVQRRLGEVAGDLAGGSYDCIGARQIDDRVHARVDPNVQHPRQRLQ